MKNKKQVILCIDDDTDLLDSMQLILEGDGYVVARAVSGEEGLKRFKEAKPDLVIVDLMMEEVDSGVIFVKDIRASGATVPIYMLSSVGDGLTLCTDYTELGLAGVLQKPVTPAKLLATLRAKLR